MFALVTVLFLSVTFADKSNVFNGNDFHDLRFNLKPSNIEVINLPIDLSLSSDEINQKDVKYSEEKESKGSKNRGNFAFSYEEEDDDGSYDGTWVDTIPGKVGKDFPAYSEIPKTKFSCKGRKVSGYFADVETDCQVFHICIEGGQKISFLCPNGSIFNQKVSVCDWWYDVDCISSTNQVDYVNDISKHNIAYENQDFEYQNFIVEEEPYDLSLASSGGNENPSKTQEKKKNQVFNQTDDFSDEPFVNGQEIKDTTGRNRLRSKNKDI